MNEHFTRFDPETMDVDEYVNYAEDHTPHFDLKVVSALAGAFNPLIETFHARVKPQLSAEFLESLRLSGGEPALKLYRPSWKRGTHSSLFRDYPLEHFDEYLYSRHGFVKGDLNLYVPIGEYGSEFALANITTARAFYSLAKQSLYHDSEALQKKYSQVIKFDTFQNRPLDSFLEGIQTTAGMLAVLTAQEVPGYEEDPLKLSQDIVQDGVLNWLAGSSANGRIFPLIRDGFHFPNPLTAASGKLAVQEDVKQVVNREREAFRKYVATDAARGRGCPVAHKTIEVFSEGETKKTSGVDLLAGVYVEALEYFMSRDNSVIPSKHSFGDAISTSLFTGSTTYS